MRWGGVVRGDEKRRAAWAEIASRGKKHAVSTRVCVVSTRRCTMARGVGGRRKFRSDQTALGLLVGGRKTRVFDVGVRPGCHWARESRCNKKAFPKEMYPHVEGWVIWSPFGGALGAVSCPRRRGDPCPATSLKYPTFRGPHIVTAEPIHIEHRAARMNCCGHFRGVGFWEGRVACIAGNDISQLSILLLLTTGSLDS